MKPIVESGILEAAAPKRISGMAVKIPKATRIDVSKGPEKSMIGEY